MNTDNDSSYRPPPQGEGPIATYPGAMARAAVAVAQADRLIGDIQKLRASYAGMPLEEMSVALSGLKCRAEDVHATLERQRSMINTPDTATNLDRAREIRNRMGYPVHVIPSFDLGHHAGTAHSDWEFDSLVRRCLDASPVTEVLVAAGPLPTAADRDALVEGIIAEMAATQPMPDVPIPTPFKPPATGDKDADDAKVLEQARAWGACRQVPELPPNTLHTEASPRPAMLGRGLTPKDVTAIVAGAFAIITAAMIVAFLVVAAIVRYWWG